MRIDISKTNKAVVLIVLSLLLVAISLALTSCGRVVVGSGNVKTETRDVRNFNKISLAGMGNLIIKQGDEESLKIEAEDNILPIITTGVNNGQLDIGFRSSGFPVDLMPSKPINFFLTVRDLNGIDLSGAANIKEATIKTDTMDLSTSGSSDVAMNIEANELTSRSSGSTKFNMSGTVDRQEVDISGSGIYSAADLASKECRVSINGSGSCTVKVSTRLNVSISGSGDVSYIGNPSVSQSISGSGTVRKLSR
ncbi:MAG: head GIN domain-containing protein [Candidatus Aquicultor sp.]